MAERDLDQLAHRVADAGGDDVVVRRRPAAASATSRARSRRQSPSRAARRGCRAPACRPGPSLMRATPSVTLRVTNSRPRRGDSWLNRMPGHGEQVVALAVVDRDVVREHLRHAVRAARIERRQLGLRHLAHLAEHLARRRLVEADRRVDLADRLEHARHALRVELAGQHRLIPRRRHERHRREVVELVRPDLVDERASATADRAGRPGCSVMRSSRCSMRQKFGALARRTMPTTS